MDTVASLHIPQLNYEKITRLTVIRHSIDRLLEIDNRLSIWNT